MKEINIRDPWAVTVEENNIGGPIKFSDPLLFPGVKFHVPKTVGYWRINESFQVHVAKRPNRLNRAMTKLLLGWEWVDT